MRRAFLSVAVAMAAPGLVAGCASGGDDRPLPASADGPDRAVVVEVTDGDTVRVSVEGVEERVRLIGINAPERDECFAAEAAEALAALVEGRTVRMERDESDRDQFERLLRYLYVDDTFVNEVLVRDGFAQAYRYEPDVAEAERLDAAQQEAAGAGRGLWAADACGRADPDAGALEIERIEADPPGDDTLDPNAEFVVVRNAGDSTVDLTGWGLKDESASHRFAFPDGFSLAAGAAVSIRTGCGEATATDLYWCNRGSAIWNNDGDTAFLLDPSGNVVDTLGY